MTPEQEANMRAEIGEFAQAELIDLAIRLQNTVDIHMHEKTGFRNSIEQLNRQNQALVQENEQLENEVGGGINSEEADWLQARVDELEQVNIGLQKTIVTLSIGED